MGPRDRATRPPCQSEPPATRDDRSEAGSGAWGQVDEHVHIRRGDTLEHVLLLKGLGAADSYPWLRAAQGVYDLRLVQPKRGFSLKFDRATRQLESVRYEIDGRVAARPRARGGRVHGDGTARGAAVLRGGEGRRRTDRAWPARGHHGGRGAARDRVGDGGHLRLGPRGGSAPEPRRRVPGDLRESLGDRKVGADPGQDPRRRDRDARSAADRGALRDRGRVGRLLSPRRWRAVA